MSKLLDQAVDSGATLITNAIKAWDKQNVEELRDMIADLNEFCEANDLHTDSYLDMTSLPSAEIPADVDTGYPVWAMDLNGGLLVGDTGDETMTLEEYRAELAA